MGKIIFKNNSSVVLSPNQNIPVITTYPTYRVLSGEDLGHALLFNTPATSVPGDFTFQDSFLVPTQNSGYYTAIFYPNDLSYETVTFQAQVLFKAQPIISVIPTGNDIYITDPLSNSILSGGIALDPYTNENISGTWEWVNTYGYAWEEVSEYPYPPFPPVYPGVLFCPSNLNLYISNNELSECMLTSGRLQVNT